MKYMVKIFAICMVVVLAFSSLVLADGMNMDKGVEKKVDGIGVGLSFKSDKAQTGNNDIMITLHDSSDKPIPGASVSATAEMDKGMSMDMKDSKPVAVTFKNGDDQGQYMGTINFTDKGKWIIKAVVKVNGQEKNVEFDTDVAGAGPNWTIIGGFFGVIVIVILAAAVKKKNTAKKA